jgi:ribosome-associated protein
LTLALASVAARAASTKTLERTAVLDVGDLFGITDYFVITAGRNERQIRSIVDEISKQVRDAGGGSVRQVEGMGDLAWVLLDYGDFIVHIFSAEARSFYDLERLWRDASTVEIEGMLEPEAISG